jgi:LmbE family N-acetylglucosaminyl deacetylase
MKRFFASVFFIAVVSHAPAAKAQAVAPAGTHAHDSIRALLIVAHPDDEYEMAGTIYRITKELSGVVDQVIITDGEAGYRYSFLASRYYGIDLTDEATGRARLPHMREEEARRAGQILGIRHQWFLNEPDEHFTLNAEEALKSWHTRRVLGELAKHLRNGRYDVVFVPLPTEDTHGQHKAASLLALQVIQEFPANQRPAVLGAQASSKESDYYATLASNPVTAATSSKPQFHFDRDARFGFRNSLSYEIVVVWAIAEHKSQGLFQTKCGQVRFENFWLFAVRGGSAIAQTAAHFEKISPQSQTAERSR